MKEKRGFELNLLLIENRYCMKKRKSDLEYRKTNDMSNRDIQR